MEAVVRYNIGHCLDPASPCENAETGNAGHESEPQQRLESTRDLISKFSSKFSSGVSSRFSGKISSKFSSHLGRQHTMTLIAQVSFETPSAG